VKINLDFRKVDECFWAGESMSVTRTIVPTPSSGPTTETTTEWVENKSIVSTPSLKSASLFVDYIYLDTDERRRFAQVSHEYLIEQLQFTGDESVMQKDNKIKLNFNHPTKELIWVVQKEEVLNDSAMLYNKPKSTLGKQWFNFTDSADQSMVVADWESAASGSASGGFNFVSETAYNNGDNPVATAKLQLNGHDRFSERDGRYFNLVQPYQHHENIPAKGINVYSFGLQPENHQPSGTCNMSRIDNAILNLKLTDTAVVGNSPNKVKVFAVNYNVLRVMSGMGGLAYSN
jgi:hypothetical protein